MADKVFIGVGHGGRDGGAVSGGLVEKDVNLVMAIAMAEELRRFGVEVCLSRTVDQEDRLQQEIDACNSFAPRVAVEVHNNAGGGDGFEVYCQTGGRSYDSRRLAEEIEKQVVKMGQNSRGIKIRVEKGVDYFGWLRQCRCPAVLCEGFFLDNAKDRTIADTVEKQMKLGAAYAKGVLCYLGVDAPETLYRVQVGAFHKRENAKALAKKLTQEGHSIIIKQ